MPDIKKSLHILASATLLPLTAHPLVFVALLMLACPVCLTMADSTNMRHIIPYLTADICISYAATCLLTFLPTRPLRIVATAVVFTLYAAMLILDIYCMALLRTEMNQDYIGIILESNSGEIFEFLSHTVFRHTLIVAAIILIAGAAIALCVLKRKAIGCAIGAMGAFIGRNRTATLIALLLSVAITAADPSVFEKHPIVRLKWFYIGYDYPDLKEFYTHPDLKDTAAAHPDHLVFIIGESLSRSHCSTMGYPLPTQPRLEKLQREGALYAFDHVASLRTSTVRARRTLLSTYRDDIGTDWWACTSIPEILSLCGYKTYWLSNQAETGMHDVFATQYARLCDYHCFTTHNNTFNSDEALITMSDTVLRDTAARKAVVYHLLGQHLQYKRRYPAERIKFSEADYADKPEHQRSMLAHYDNSVAYNDSIIAEIIGLYADKNTVVVYMPDHGQDLYETNPYHCGHAQNTAASIQTAVQIPLFIYVSESYRREHPDIVALMKRYEHREWKSSETLYTLMQLAGYRFANNDDVRKYSILGH